MVEPLAKGKFEVVASLLEEDSADGLVDDFLGLGLRKVLDCCTFAGLLPAEQVLMLKSLVVFRTFSTFESLRLRHSVFNVVFGTDMLTVGLD